MKVLDLPEGQRGCSPLSESLPLNQVLSVSTWEDSLTAHSDWQVELTMKSVCVPTDVPVSSDLTGVTDCDLFFLQMVEEDIYHSVPLRFNHFLTGRQWKHGNTIHYL